MSYRNIVTTIEGPIAIVQLNRPEVLNALSMDLMRELATALESFDRDEKIRAIVLTGNDRAFSTGADLKEMSQWTAVQGSLGDRIALWDRIAHTSKPIVAAVSGYAFGGGNELMMACDVVVASETATFGQPEVNVGIMPGAGGTQRLTRTVGKHRAMEMILTGRTISAREAERLGLVNKVVPVESYLDEAKRIAREIASKAPVAVRIAKSAILHAYESTLQMGLDFERRSVYFLFATEDKAEGMKAFFEKRKPEFKGR